MQGGGRTNCIVIHLVFLKEGSLLEEGRVGRSDSLSPASQLGVDSLKGSGRTQMMASRALGPCCSTVRTS